MDRLRLGSIVISKAGHDRGDVLIVTGIEQTSDYIYLADGKNRKVEAPKKKKLKHVFVTNKYSEKINDILERSELPDDALVKKELEEYKKLHFKETGEC